MKLKFTILFIFLFFELIFAQDIFNKKFEVSGTINYSYSKNVNDIQEGENFQRYYLRHILDIQPSIGYLIFPNIQLSLTSLYEYEYNKYNFNHYTSSGVEEDTETRVWQKLGIEFGPMYNYGLNQSFVVFAGAKLGLVWSFYDSNILPPRGSKWGKAQITFPIALIGVKYFFESNWALITQLQYKYTSNLSGISSTNQSNILLGVGIAIYL